MKTADKELRTIIIQKKTNLILSLDVTDKLHFFSVLYDCKEYICAVKLHLDCYTFMDDKAYDTLFDWAEKYNFIIIEDRKFADIGNTNRLQALRFMNIGIRYFTSHIFMGKDSIENFPENCCVFLIANMSCKGSYFSDKIQLEPLLESTSKSYYDKIPNVIGFVSQKNIETNSEKYPLILRPGVRLPGSHNNDTMGQIYKPPEIYPGVCWVVGREIIHAKEPKKVAEKYKNIFTSNFETWNQSI